MLSDDDFRKLLDFFERPWAGYRKVRKGVKKRIRRHMAAVGIADIENYLKLLARDSQARKSCDECLQVTISRFFRDRNLWLYLGEELLPLLAEEKPEGVNLWSIGCGCGEEVYSIAILWRRLQIKAPLIVLATDINPENLARGVEGCYQQSSLREVPKPLLGECFIRERGSRNYTVAAEYRDNISWLHHDLFSRLGEQRFQIIFLRNSLLTYYQGSRRNQALARVISHLEPGGYLVVGSHEKIPDRFSQLSRVEKCCYLYRFSVKAGDAL